jgi:hypothetical protein
MRDKNSSSVITSNISITFIGAKKNSSASTPHTTLGEATMQILYSRGLSPKKAKREETHVCIVHVIDLSLINDQCSGATPPTSTLLIDTLAVDERNHRSSVHCNHGERQTERQNCNWHPLWYYIIVANIPVHAVAAGVAHTRTMMEARVMDGVMVMAMIAVDISRRNRLDSNNENDNDDDASTVYTSCSNQHMEGRRQS